MKNKKLMEAIENVAEVNNMKDQNFDKTFVGTAPVSYADAVLQERKKKAAVDKMGEKHRKQAMASLKKEVSNEEHPEPIEKVKMNTEGKLELNESLFESFEDEHIGKCDCKKEIKEGIDEKSLFAAKIVDKYYDEGNMSLEQLHKELLDVFGGDVKSAYEFLLNYDSTRNKMNEAVEEKVYKVTYKTSPSVYSSFMIKADSEDDAKKKTTENKISEEDIIGISEMTSDEVEDMRKRGMSLLEAKLYIDFDEYEPWSGAEETYNRIVNEDKLDDLERLVDEVYPEGISRTELNDLLWFDSDWVYEMLGMKGDDEEEEVEEEETSETEEE